MRTTLDLPDPLFARLKARAARERITLNQLLHLYVEQGLDQQAAAASVHRSAAALPGVEGELAIPPDQLSNAGLAAVQYWEELAAGEVRFCTVTALGLVRLLCQPKVMGKAVHTPPEASAVLSR